MKDSLYLSNPREAYRKGSPYYADLLRFCESNRGNILASIPFGGAEIAGHCGFAALFGLIAWQGGWTVYVPTNGNIDGVLRRAAGDEAYAWLVEQFGGDRLEIPLCPEILRAYRTVLVRRMIAEGATNWEIAEQFNISERTARRWRNAAGDAERRILGEAGP